MGIYLIDDLSDTKTCVDGEWVIARPINYKYRGFTERFKDAWLVFVGKADAVRFVEGRE